MLFKVALVFLCLSVACNALFIPRHTLHSLTDDAAVTCDRQKMTQCDGAYLTSIGAPHITTADQLIMAIDRFEKENGGRNGFDLICGFHRTYTSCMGETNLAQCMNVTYLMNSLHYSSKNAYEVVEIYNGYAYKCTPSVQKILDDNYKCLLDAAKTHEHGIEQCSRTFSEEMHNHPNNTMMCKNGAEFGKCYNDIYESACPSTGEVLCNILRVELESVWPWCDYKCNAGK